MTVPLFGLVAVTLAAWALLRRRRILTAGGGVAAVAGLAAASSVVRPRPRLSDLGVNPLAGFFATCSAVVLAADVILFSARGLSLDWPTVWPYIALLAALLVVWINFYVVPGSPREHLVAETVLVVFLIILLTNVASPMQYGAVALGAPFADRWLAMADASGGIHVASFAAWTRAHATVALVANLVYVTLLPQFLFAVIALAALRDRARLWEFAFHFHVCLILTVAALMVFPAVHAPAFYGFTPAIDMTRLIAQIERLHDGTMRVVRFDELEGLVSFPSFHVAGALIVTWAFRDRPRFLVPLLVLNTALTLSTFVTGVHYVVDVLAALPLVAMSVGAYRWWGRGLLPMPSDD
jgi:hypothetical protein